MNTLFIVLPVLALVSAAGLGFALTHRARASLLFSALLNSLFVLGYSEGLSAVHRLSPGWIIGGWCAWTVLLLAAAWASCAVGAAALAARCRSEIGAFTGAAPWSIAGLAVILAPLTVVAAFGLPNNWDSLTYHLPRILYWLQNGSLRFFATDDYRQLFNPPLAELWQMHVWILGGLHDPVMNFVQWGAFAGVVAAASMITEALGGSRRAQAFSALACGTLPMAVLQAATTQNDMLLAFFLLATLAFLLAAFRETSFHAFWMAGVAAAGLALATKGTAFLFLPFVGVVPVLRAVRARRWLALAALALALLPSAGWIGRNYRFFGNAFGYQSDASAARGENYYANTLRTPAEAVVCAGKNLSLLIATPVRPLNTALERMAVRLAHGLGVNPDEDRFLWYDSRFEIPQTGPIEDVPPLLWHVVLAAGLLLFGRSAPSVVRGQRLGIAAGLVLGMIAMSAYLKWMPWNLRFQGLWLLLLLPVLGATGGGKRVRWAPACALALVLLALPFATLSVHRSLVPLTLTAGGQKVEFACVFARDAAVEYLPGRPALSSSLTKTVSDVVPLCPTSIGIERHGDAAVYPVMALLRRALPGVPFTPIGFTNESGRLSSPIAPRTRIRITDTHCGVDVP